MSQSKTTCNSPHPDHSSEFSRLNRMSGQIDGIKKMIEDKRYCVEILTQLKAVQSAAKAVEGNILKRHIESCVKDAFVAKNASDREEKIDELLKLFKKS